ncbi:MAG: DUF202 domain-containing protein [Bacillota bacterium]
MNNENNKLILSAKRTTLANKRTFLSYFRTSVGCLSVAFAFIKLHENEPIDPFTIILFVLSGIFMIVGIAETLVVKKEIAKLANNPPESNKS